MLDIIIIGIENPGNLGAIARVMKNFGVRNLVLVEPLCSPKDEVARDRAMHANDILKRAKIIALSKLKKSYTTLIATTAKVGTDYNIPRSPVCPREMAGLIKPHINSKKARIGLVLGRESHGLMNKEIALCDFSVTIPTQPEYPSLNISHALAVLLYEISIAAHEKNITSFVVPADEKDKEVFLKKVEEAIQHLPFTEESKRETQRVVWKKLIGKSFLTKRELFALHGFLRKMKVKRK